MTSESTEIAILGAGVAGLAAAWELSRRGIPSLVLEKSRGLSGRAATRSHGHCRYDHGANFFKLEDDRVGDLIRHQLPTDELVEIPGRVDVFDGEGRVQPGDPAANSATKWNYRRGISTLGKLLATTAERSRVIRRTRIVRLEGTPGEWRLIDSEGKRFGPFSRLLLTPPAPQTAELLDHSGIAPELSSRLANLTYHPQFSFVLGFAHRVAPGRDFHALVNLDRSHALAWLAFEDDKPGHVPEGGSVIVAQMSPDWTQAHDDHDHDGLVSKVIAEAGSLLGERLEPPAWWDCQRWRYAHPAQAPDPELRSLATAAGLDLAGDALVGKGRVVEALRTGLEGADSLAECGAAPPPPA